MHAVTLYVNNKRPLLRNAAASYWLTHYLYDFQDEGAFALHAWVILPDHIHCIVELPANSDIDLLVRRFINASAIFLNRLFDTRDLIFWDDAFDIVKLNTADECILSIGTLFFDPVNHNLVDDPIDYPFTSYHHFLHQYGEKELDRIVKAFQGQRQKCNLIRHRQ